MASALKHLSSVVFTTIRVRHTAHGILEDREIVTCYASSLLTPCQLTETLETYG